MPGKVDLAAAILELALKEIPPQSIRERLGISATDFGKHLQMLESKALVNVSKQNKVSVTKRGTQFLALYNSIRARYLSIPA